MTAKDLLNEFYLKYFKCSACFDIILPYEDLYALRCGHNICTRCKHIYVKQLCNKCNVTSQSVNAKLNKSLMEKIISKMDSEFYSLTNMLRGKFLVRNFDVSRLMVAYEELVTSFSNCDAKTGTKNKTLKRYEMLEHELLPKAKSYDEIILLLQNELKSNLRKQVHVPLSLEIISDPASQIDLYTYRPFILDMDLLDEMRGTLKHFYMYTDVPKKFGRRYAYLQAGEDRLRMFSFIGLIPPCGSVLFKYKEAAKHEVRNVFLLFGINSDINQASSKQDFRCLTIAITSPSDCLRTKQFRYLLSGERGPCYRGTEVISENGCKLPVGYKYSNGEFQQNNILPDIMDRLPLKFSYPKVTEVYMGLQGILDGVFFIVVQPQMELTKGLLVGEVESGFRTVMESEDLCIIDCGLIFEVEETGPPLNQ